MELQCLAWQARSAAHRLAFERCTEVWMEVPNAARAAGYVLPPTRRKARPLALVSLMSLGVLVAGAVLAGAWLAIHAMPLGTEYRTAIGEAQTVVLADGTRMHLNTDTRLSVAFSPGRRSVDVARGEVAFDVAKDAARPFVVRAAGSEVQALGTSFTVRLATAGQAAAPVLSVTLLEGQVAVRPAAEAQLPTGTPTPAVILHPGERVQIGQASAGAVSLQQLSSAALDQATAWKRHQVVFDKTSLPDAIAEMNRYSTTPLVLSDPDALSQLQISGSYPTGDNAGFARAVAAVHGLVVHERPERLELAPSP
jgi:transmembrane sensor